MDSETKNAPAAQEMNSGTPVQPAGLEQTPAPQLVPATRPSALHWTFIGDDGLRAGWGLFLFLILFSCLSVGGYLIARKGHAPSRQAHRPPEISIVRGFMEEAIPLLAVFLITWLMAKIERRPFGVYGLGDRRKGAHFFAGVGWGISCLTVLILILLKTGLLVVDRRLLFGSDILRYGAVWLLGFLLVGFFEEFFTRGYMQYTLTRGMAYLYEHIFKTRHSVALGFWTSAIFFSIMFGLGHRGNPGESPIGLLSAGLAGLVFCYSLWRTGSLWWAIGFHMSWDWGQSFLYGVADSGIMVEHHLLATHPTGKPILSGGLTGPEGSIFILVILALVGVIILTTLSGPHFKENLRRRAAFEDLSYALEDR